MTRRAAFLFAVGAAAAAVAGAGLTAAGAVAVLESRVTSQVGAVLGEADGWVQLDASGTLLTVTGAAPDRAAQIAALARIGSAAAGITILDRTTVTDAEAAAAPVPGVAAELSLELLRSGAEVTLFGSVPEQARDGFAGRQAALAGMEITDMLSPAAGTVDSRWPAAVEVGFAALSLMERGRVSVVPGAVRVAAAAPSEEARAEWLARLERAAAGRVVIEAEISVPRAVISPYVFRAEIAAGGPLRLLACTAEDETTAGRLAAMHGAPEPAPCAIGLGAPAPEWEQAVIAALEVLAELGEGSVDFADADVAVTGPQGYDAQAFADSMDRLAAALPPVFSLSASLPPPPALLEEGTDVEPPRFTAVRTEDGAVRIRGDVTDDRMRETAATFAEAKFGFDAVINETEPREDLPSGWAVRVVTGLEALGALTTGQLEITDGMVTLTGATPTLESRGKIEALLRSRLPDDVEIAVEVWEAEALEVSSPFEVPAELCAEQIDLILASETITFPPGETAIDEASLPIIDRIAEVMGNCPGARFEIGGHTDSQGRESSNMALSQSRADAVLAALLERNVDTVFLFARGYGETRPVADNETEEGRAKNRRIAFELVTESTDAAPAPAPQPETVQASAGPDAGDADAQADAGAPEIETARRESPTTIVVPAGTDPASLLPQAALDASAEGSGDDEGLVDEEAPEDGPAPLVIEQAPEIVPPLRAEALDTAALTEGDAATPGDGDAPEGLESAGEEGGADALPEGSDAAATEAGQADADEAAATPESAAPSDGAGAAADAAAAQAAEEPEDQPATAVAGPEPTRPMPRSGNLPGSGG